MENITTILKLWDVDFFRIVPQALCFGSPERSLYRIVVEDQQGKLYILEQIARNTKERKYDIALHLEQLKNFCNELKIVPYLISLQNNYISCIHEQYWMLTPYIPAEVLCRPDYLSDPWRGQLMAEFLLDLHQSSQTLLSQEKTPELPPLNQYILKLMDSIQSYHPQVFHALTPIFDYLKGGLFPKLDTMETGFCHGDYHPLNILWKNQNILAVIDWEFSGSKPFLYDVANMLGCLGMEHPDTLVSPISLEFIRRLRKAGFGTEKSWSELIDLMVAIRFAWLSEWFRKSDWEMVELETDYMHLLMEEQSVLFQQWDLVR